MVRYVRISIMLYTEDDPFFGTLLVILVMLSVYTFKSNMGTPREIERSLQRTAPPEVCLSKNYLTLLQTVRNHIIVLKIL